MYIFIRYFERVTVYICSDKLSYLSNNRVQSKGCLSKTVVDGCVMPIAKSCPNRRCVKLDILLFNMCQNVNMFNAVWDMSDHLTWLQFSTGVQKISEQSTSLVFILLSKRWYYSTYGQFIILIANSWLYFQPSMSVFFEVSNRNTILKSDCTLDWMVKCTHDHIVVNVVYIYHIYMGLSILLN